MGEEQRAVSPAVDYAIVDPNTPLHLDVRERSFDRRDLDDFQRAKSLLYEFINQHIPAKQSGAFPNAP